MYRPFLLRSSRIPLRRLLATAPGKPSPEYLSEIGEQPTPGEEVQTPRKVTEEDQKTAIYKAARKRSLRMTFWQMFLVTFIGSCALNIMRVKNTAEEYDDNYRMRFREFDEIIDGIKNGRTTIEDVEDQLYTSNDRFENLFHLPGSYFNGTRGLDKVKLRKLYEQYKDIPEDSEEPQESEEPQHPPTHKLDMYL